MTMRAFLMSRFHDFKFFKPIHKIPPQKILLKQNGPEKVVHRRGNFCAVLWAAERESDITVELR